MSDKISVSQRTKHVDVRFRFIQQYVMEGFIKVIFVKTDENDADLFTKNLSGDKYSKHSDKLFSNKEFKMENLPDYTTGRVLR